MRKLKNIFTGILLLMMMAVPSSAADTMTPATGDRSQIFMWIILLVTAVVAVILLAVIRKRDR